ncbi:hypothetical protein [Bernardetia sp.]|uniref:hypothetical protein n=1 Tax=Bernardetia sp. TaxID=1937974 RepID=UPI0025BE453D|nr:hypothetical protein [Bernardetia sp.]
MSSQKHFTYLNTLLIVLGIVFPFIFLKDAYPFHRFGMFAEPVQHKAQYEQFHIFYVFGKDTNFVELLPQNIPLNANAFQMQVRKHHYQKTHTYFINVFEKIIKNKYNSDEKIKWKWYHVKENSQNEIDSVCVFSN